ncbi:hypothetical protein [Streptomyces sp. NPDC014685]|uniref:hypothetical protein n=1 Tax=Streptomyces sp. NPDC014685 TaxID=3364881 RepID=UPI0036FF09C1
MSCTAKATMARCTVERLTPELGVTGAVRGKKIITTIPDSSVERAPDLLDRDFVAPAPNRCRAVDFTHLTTWPGVVHAAFVVDTFSRRIVGWSAAPSKETRLVLDAPSRTPVPNWSPGMTEGRFRMSPKPALICDSHESGRQDLNLRPLDPQE